MYDYNNKIKVFHILDILQNRNIKEENKNERVIYYIFLQLFSYLGLSSCSQRRNIEIDLDKDVIKVFEQDQWRK